LGVPLAGFACLLIAFAFRISDWPMLAMRLARRLFHLLA
jgi:hypothetical protein